MVDRVRVRLVPKTKDARSITMDFAGISPQTAKSHAPDPERAAIAFRATANLRVEAKVTGRDRIDMLTTSDDLRRVFNAEIVAR